MDTGFEIALKHSTLTIGPSGPCRDGVNKWPECSKFADMCGSDPVLDTEAPSLCATNKKRKLLDLQLTSSQISDDTCDAAAAVVMTLNGIAGNIQQSIKSQRCMAAPDTPPTPGRVLPAPVPPFTPYAAAAAAAVAEVALQSTQCTITSLKAAADTASVQALPAIKVHAAAADAEQPAEDVQQQQSSVVAAAAAPQEPLLHQEQENDLLFSPPASPAAAPAAPSTTAPAAAVVAGSISAAASPVLDHSAAKLQQQPHLQSLLVVAKQLAATGATGRSTDMAAAAGARHGTTRSCQFLPATQATLQATTANVVAAEALAAALAAAKIDQTGRLLQQQQQLIPTAAAVLDAQGQKSPMSETLQPQQQQLLLPNWLCSSSANLAASAAVVRSSLLNATAALARLQQQQQYPGPGHTLTNAAAAAVAQPPVAGLGPLPHQQQQLGSVVLGVPVVGARVWGYPVYPEEPTAAAAVRPCADVAAAAADYLDGEQQQQFDMEMDDAISCSSTPRSAAAAAGGCRHPPRAAAAGGKRQQQHSSDSRDVNEWDPECDDSASSKCTDESSAGSQDGDSD